jgi:NADH dehydrogenase (ubiquinone) flavoprotein 1
MCIAGFAMGASKAFIHIRGEFILEANMLDEAVAQVYQKGFLGSNACGSGIPLMLLSMSLEGKPGKPRLKPPFLANVGLYGYPSTVTDICGSPTIRGASWFADFGCPNNSGTKLFCISGHVKNPITVEGEMSIPLRN